MQSPTGWTKQLISVASSAVPAALMMRPAPIAPARRLAWNRACHLSRSPSASTEASARATRANRSSKSFSPGLRYFSCSTSRVIGCTASELARISSRFILLFLFLRRLEGRLRPLRALPPVLLAFPHAGRQDAAEQPLHQFMRGADLIAERQPAGATEKESLVPVAFQGLPEFLVDAELAPGRVAIAQTAMRQAAELQH